MGDNHDWSSDATAKSPRAEAPASPRLRVIAGGRATLYPLPESGRVVLGRSSQADVRIEHASVSRQHAALHVGPTLSVEDLGSQNGTRLRNVPLKPNQPVELSPNDIIELGGVLVLVEGTSGPTRVRRFCSHGYFEIRLEEELERAARTNGQFAVARLFITTKESAAAVRNLLAEVMRPADLIAAYADSDYELLLFDCDVDGAKDVLRRVTRRLEAGGVTLRATVAHFPTDARSAADLIAAAGELPETAVDAASVVVADPAMRRIHDLVARVADSDLNVLLLGETGVGKEVLARLVHERSPRHAAPFVEVNCAALPESLAESELFGHEAGAFTGASKRKVGLLEAASGGSFFLDEVGEMPLALQPKLLRALETGTVMPVGATSPRKVNIRLIAATNRNLEAEVQRGKFREDLFFRLNGIAITIPPLRERRGEIAGLARLFITRAAERRGRRAPELNPESLTLLERYRWPGNIRELRNLMERAVVLADDRVLPSHLPLDKLTSEAGREAPEPVLLPSRAPAADANDAAATLNLRNELEDLERQRVVEALAQAKGNQSAAAKLLGVSRSTLVRRLERYGLLGRNKGSS